MHWIIFSLSNPGILENISNIALWNYQLSGARIKRTYVCSSSIESNISFPYRNWSNTNSLRPRKIKCLSRKHTWTALYRDSVCKDSPASGPTTGSRHRSHCSIRRIRAAARGRFLGRTATCIAAPTVPSTSSSSRDSTIGTPACMRICKPIYRPPRRRRGPSGNPTARRAPPRSEAFLQTAPRDLLSTAACRNTCTI